MENNEPATINVEEAYYADFERLIAKDSPLRGRDKKHIFIMAMVKGFLMKSRKEVKKKHSGGYFRVEYLLPPEKSLIKAIALYEEKDLTIYSDPKKIYSIAEEYASGGIKYLKDDILSKQHGTYVKRLEADLVEKVKKILKDNEIT